MTIFVLCTDGSSKLTTPLVQHLNTLFLNLLIVTNIIQLSKGFGTDLNHWDEHGSEAGEHAQIWYIYNDESAKVDAAVIDGCNRGIDVLLVFSYQQMLPSPSDTTNALLLTLISDLRSSSLNISDTNISIPTPPGSNSPSASQIRWVNGLWFAALSFSLSAALVSMLAKQWIQPIPNVSGSPRYRARRRQQRYLQLQNWHVFFVINALPMLLHIALLLFFAGIIMLLWSGDLGIVIATFTIVALAYIFYAGSMWMSLTNPDCPYQHPISEELRRWVTRYDGPTKLLDLERTAILPIRAARTVIGHITPSSDDDMDAHCLVWLLQQCTNDDIIAATLKSIGGLPYDFAAFHVLREAGAIPMVLQHFNNCFRRDISFDSQWHVADAESAEGYCRAWIRLTHGTSHTWPQDLRRPLHTLRDGSTDLHINAIATCTWALDSPESRSSHLSLLSHLSQLAIGDQKYSELSQRWLLETFLECTLSWELHKAVVNDITAKSVPILLQLLQRATDQSGSQNHTTIAAILHSLTVGEVNAVSLWDEKKRYFNFHKIAIPSLAAIIRDPCRFGVEGELLDFTVTEFSRLAAPAFMSEYFPTHVKDIARQGLSKLYLEGRVGVGVVPDSVLADILQILYPPVKITEDQHPLFVKTLVQTLANSNDVNIAISSIRLLERLLTNCPSSVVRSFAEENGVPALLRSAHAGETDSRRLQIECIRTLCIFIHSSASSSTVGTLCPSHPPAIEKQFDAIFQSDFFIILIAVIDARRWWLEEIAEIWVPSLLLLCQARPHERIWKSVETVLRKFAELNDGEHGSERLIADLDKMKDIF
ncbi:hypothetical protein JR316_0001799 [Psilocybe cubensis]|uniref:Uncharacterized protein n=2 Tax=Psilocybe cubensis TaxID=181762 RepID=A0ACB8HB68_PSICU|nr:hypothetical protein JR316_0001799 [Psilocybe cubensis]KAH9484897.1 hypothetical protein JR316_0001799 [Psilocybe cubensis]